VDPPARTPSDVAHLAAPGHDGSARLPGRYGRRAVGSWHRLGGARVVGTATGLSQRDARRRWGVGARIRAFRLTHLRDEGARVVRLEAADARLTVGERVASCVVDIYANGPAIEHYREVACARSSPFCGVDATNAMPGATGGGRTGSLGVTAEHGRP
jgi:hypothetical protein